MTIFADNPKERDSLMRDCAEHLAEAIAFINLQNERIQRLEENLRQATIQRTEQVILVIA